SKKTGRVRNVIVDGEHILSMRAHDGLFTLRLAGGEILHRAFPKPSLRVVVETETAEFNRQGKNVFAKFVRGADPNLRPMDEVLPETVVTMTVPSSTRRDLATFSARAFEGYANSSRHVMRTRLPWGGRVKRLAGHDSERVAIRYSRRAVLLALLFGLIAVLAMALFASLLTGSYEILA